MTTPLFYVNSAPHIGHAYSSVLADALNRWNGSSSRLLVGTDEHGQKIQAAAKSRGKDILPFCNEISQTFKESFDALGVQYDAFVRTTSANHEQTVRALWSRLTPHIELGKHEGWYCASDEAFVPATNVDEAAKTLKGSKHTVEWVSEPNYRFKYNPQVLKRELQDRCAILPGSSRRNEVLGLLDSSGEEQFISVSRPRHRVPWAIEVPGDPTQSIYVWVDALAGYITASGSILNPDSKSPAFIEDKFDNVIHIVGKDILKFHCVHWPAFLMAAGIAVPSKVIAHAHWTVNGTKMSKSLGNVISPFVLLNTICKGQPDVLRYFLLRDGRLEDDADFSHEALIDRVDSELADNIGNLLSRVCAASMWQIIPEGQTARPSESHRKLSRKLFADVAETFSQADFGRGLESLIRFMNNANSEFQQREPWTIISKAKKTGGMSTEAMEELKTCLGNAMDACRSAALVLAPVSPQLSDRILERLGLSATPGSVRDAMALELGVFHRPNLQGPVLVNKLGITSMATKARATSSAKTTKGSANS